MLSCHNMSEQEIIIMSSFQFLKYQIAHKGNAIRNQHSTLFFISHHAT